MIIKKGKQKKNKGVKNDYEGNIIITNSLSSKLKVFTLGRNQFPWSIPRIQTYSILYWEYLWCVFSLKISKK